LNFEFVSNFEFRASDLKILARYKMKELKHTVSTILLCIMLLVTCKQGAYVAIEGDTIQLSAAAVTIEPGGTTVITITGIRANGQPMPDNTMVRIAVDIGTLVDYNDETKEVQAALLSSGKAMVRYIAETDRAGGTATITASAGTAIVSPEALLINIRNIDVASILISADKTQLAVGENTVAITITAYTSDNEAVPGERVYFIASSGSFDPASPMQTDANGQIKTTLTMLQDTTITATYQEISTSLDVTVALNTPPVAAFTFAPAAPAAKQRVQFASASTDAEDGTNLSYKWEFGEADIAGQSNSENPYHTYNDAGAYAVKLTVTDSVGSTGSITQIVSVGGGANNPPVADFTFSPTTPTTDDHVQFNGSKSYDPDSDALTYNWNFGDPDAYPTDNIAQGESVSHQYQTPGTFIVTLDVSDPHGATSVISYEVTIAVLLAVFSYQQTSPAADKTIEFDAGNSLGDIVLYHWDFGDGQIQRGTEPTITHVYPSASTYNVFLTVTDSSSNTNRSRLEVVVYD
jgi:PKD repeat protein